MKYNLYLEQSKITKKMVNKKQKTINKSIHFKQIYTFEFWIKFN